MRRGSLLGSAVVAIALLGAPAGVAQEAKPQAPGGEGGPTKGANAGSDAAQGREDGPDVVRVGALINDVQQLDLQSHSYNVDMYMWFKWDDPEINPARSFEFLNAFEFWGHIISYETSTPEKLPDGSYLQVFRNQGKFNTKLPLEKYPFDTQHLTVEIEDSVGDERDIVYKPDKDPVTLSRGLTIPGWDVGEPTMRIISNTYDSSFGDPRTENLSYSRAIIDLPLTRPAGTYSLKLLLPMLLVALTAALSLAIHPKYVEGRIAVGITALLTLVALQITSNSSLPEVDYLILLDKLYILSYGFVVLTMAIIVRNSWVDASGNVDAAIHADRVALAWLTGAYIVAATLLMVLTLT